MKKKVITVLSLVCGIILGSIMGTVFTMYKSSVEKDKWKKLSDKHFSLMLLFNQWLDTKQQGKSIIDYLHKENISTVAIYGMSYVGERLYNELKDSDLIVKYVIDKNADTIYSEVEIISPSNISEKVDAIIVTPIVFFEDIKKELSSKVNCPIISLKDILYRL